MSLRLTAVVAVLAMCLSGCVSVMDEFADRGNVPIPATLVAQMSEKGMSSGFSRKRANWRYGNRIGQANSLI
jgi:starvation-inducible outer membrane lipoprotein